MTSSNNMNSPSNSQSSTSSPAPKEIDIEQICSLPSHAGSNIRDKSEVQTLPTDAERPSPHNSQSPGQPVILLGPSQTRGPSAQSDDAQNSNQPVMQSSQAQTNQPVIQVSQSQMRGQSTQSDDAQNSNQPVMQPSQPQTDLNQGQRLTPDRQTSEETQGLVQAPQPVNQTETRALVKQPADMTQTGRSQIQNLPVQADVQNLNKPVMQPSQSEAHSNLNINQSQTLPVQQGHPRMPAGGQTTNQSPTLPVQQGHPRMPAGGQTTNHSPTLPGQQGHPRMPAGEQTTNHSPTLPVQQGHPRMPAGGQTTNHSPTMPVQQAHPRMPAGGQTTNQSPTLPGQALLRNPMYILPKPANVVVPAFTTVTVPTTGNVYITGKQLKGQPQQMSAMPGIQMNPTFVVASTLGSTAFMGPHDAGGRSLPSIGHNISTSSPLHHSDKGTACTVCGKGFQSRQQLSQHMLVHTDVRKYKCKYCDRSFKQSSHLDQHHRIHTGEKPYKCTLPGCNRSFPQLSNLNHHIRNHNQPEPSPENTCTICERTYASEMVLRTHLIKIHGCLPENMNISGHRVTPPVLLCDIVEERLSNVPPRSVADVSVTDVSKQEFPVNGGSTKQAMNTHSGYAMAAHIDKRQRERADTIFNRPYNGNKIQSFPNDYANRRFAPYVGNVHITPNHGRGVPGVLYDPTRRIPTVKASAINDSTKRFDTVHAPTNNVASGEAMIRARYQPRRSQSVSENYIGMASNDDLNSRRNVISAPPEYPVGLDPMARDRSGTFLNVNQSIGVNNHLDHTDDFNSIQSLKLPVKQPEADVKPDTCNIKVNYVHQSVSAITPGEFDSPKFEFSETSNNTTGSASNGFHTNRVLTTNLPRSCVENIDKSKGPTTEDNGKSILQTHPPMPSIENNDYDNSKGSTTIDNGNATRLSGDSFRGSAIAAILLSKSPEPGNCHSSNIAVQNRLPIRNNGYVINSRHLRKNYDINRNMTSTEIDFSIKMNGNSITNMIGDLDSRKEIGIRKPHPKHTNVNGDILIDLTTGESDTNERSSIEMGIPMDKDIFGLDYDAPDSANSNSDQPSTLEVSDSSNRNNEKTNTLEVSDSTNSNSKQASILDVSDSSNRNSGKTNTFEESDSVENNDKSKGPTTEDKGKITTQTHSQMSSIENNDSSKGPTTIDNGNMSNDSLRGSAILVSKSNNNSEQANTLEVSDNSYSHSEHTIISRLAREVVLQHVVTEHASEGIMDLSIRKNTQVNEPVQNNHNQREVQRNLSPNIRSTAQLCSPSTCVVDSPSSLGNLAHKSPSDSSNSNYEQATTSRLSREVVLKPVVREQELRSGSTSVQELDIGNSADVVKEQSFDNGLQSMHLFMDTLLKHSLIEFVDRHKDTIAEMVLKKGAKTFQDVASRIQGEPEKHSEHRNRNHGADRLQGEHEPHSEHRTHVHDGANRIQDEQGQHSEHRSRNYVNDGGITNLEGAGEAEANILADNETELRGRNHGHVGETTNDNDMFDGGANSLSDKNEQHFEIQSRGDRNNERIGCQTQSRRERNTLSIDGPSDEGITDDCILHQKLNQQMVESDRLIRNGSSTQEVQEQYKRSIEHFNEDDRYTNSTASPQEHTNGIQKLTKSKKNSGELINVNDEINREVKTEDSDNIEVGQETEHQFNYGYNYVLEEPGDVLDLSIGRTIDQVRSTDDKTIHVNDTNIESGISCSGSPKDGRLETENLVSPKCLRDVNDEINMLAVRQLSCTYVNNRPNVSAIHQLIRTEINNGQNVSPARQLSHPEVNNGPNVAPVRQLSHTEVNNRQNVSPARQLSHPEVNNGQNESPARQLSHTEVNNGPNVAPARQLSLAEVNNIPNDNADLKDFHNENRKRELNLNVPDINDHTISRRQSETDITIYVQGENEYGADDAVTDLSDHPSHIKRRRTDSPEKIPLAQTLYNDLSTPERNGIESMSNGLIPDNCPKIMCNSLIIPEKSSKIKLNGLIIPENSSKTMCNGLIVPENGYKTMSNCLIVPENSSKPMCNSPLSLENKVKPLTNGLTTQLVVNFNNGHKIQPANLSCVNASESELTAFLNMDDKNTYRYMDDMTLDNETSNSQSCSGIRKRKRKAFQPQRVLRNNLFGDDF